jgi:hypothetical protein
MPPPRYTHCSGGDPTGGSMFDRKQLYLSLALLGLAEVVTVLVVAAVR